VTREDAQKLMIRCLKRRLFGPKWIGTLNLFTILKNGSPGSKIKKEMIMMYFKKTNQAFSLYGIKKEGSYYKKGYF
jgi:hypothetical protein